MFPKSLDGFKVYIVAALTMAGSVLAGADWPGIVRLLTSNSAPEVGAAVATGIAFVRAVFMVLDLMNRRAKAAQEQANGA